MVGSKGSGNKRPINRIPIFATTEMLDFLRSLPNPKGIPFRNLIMKDFLERHKDTFIAMHGEESYKEHMEKYNLNTTEMQLSKLAKEKEANEKHEETLKLKREELELKRRELDIREENTEIRKSKPIEKKKGELEYIEEEITVKKREIKNVEGMSLRDVQRRYYKDKEDVLKELKSELNDFIVKRDTLKLEIGELEKENEA